MFSFASAQQRCLFSPHTEADRHYAGSRAIRRLDCHGV